MPPVNNVWGQNTPVGLVESVELPSGQTVEAKKIGIEGLIQAGILMEVDTLAALVQEGPVEDGKAKLEGRKSKKLTKAQQKKQQESSEKATMAMLMANPEMLAAIITVADKAIPVMCVNPPVRLHYVVKVEPSTEKPDEVVRHQRALTPLERQKIVKENPGTVFTDQIPFEDKMALFDWGVEDLGNLAEFRKPSEASLGNVGAESSVSLPAE